jgi:hypothetical protein
MMSFTENVHFIDWLTLKGLELLIYLEGVTGSSAADHSTAPRDQGQAETGNGLEAAAAGPSTGSAGHFAGHLALAIALQHAVSYDV